MQNGSHREPGSRQVKGKGAGKGQLAQNINVDNLNIDTSKRFKYSGPNQKQSEDLYPLMYHLQKKEYSNFMRGAKTLAIKKITDLPRKRLEDMIELREEILTLGNDIAARVDNLHKLLEKHAYDAETDTGLLHQDMELYEGICSVDSVELARLVEAELDYAQNDMATALQQAKDLVARMEGYLDGTQNNVKTFLENHKHEVKMASAPQWMKENSNIDKEKFSTTTFRGHSLVEAMLEDQAGNALDMNPRWQPVMHDVEAVGMQMGIKFDWPSKQEIEQLPLQQPIKLDGFGYKAGTELQDLQLYFTSDVQSTPAVKPNKTSGFTRINIDKHQTIGAVGLLQHPDEFKIYGMRLLDKDRSVIVQEYFEREYPEEAQWRNLDVPEGTEIIGLHGKHDGTRIRSVGLKVWRPNPDAQLEPPNGEDE